MLLLSAFAVLALALAAIGIVGVVSYSVAQRTHEIGIRMALGARAFDVLNMVVRSSMGWVLAGIGIGVVGSLGLTRLLRDLLYGTRLALWSSSRRSFSAGGGIRAVGSCCRLRELSAGVPSR